jgi:hypothetical protein
MPTSSADMQHWVADPNVAWNILLSARLTSPPSAADLDARLRRLYADQNWPQDPPSIASGSIADLLPAFAGARDGRPVRIGLSGAELLIGAHHQQVDGLGMLGVLAAISAERAVSNARGLSDRKPAGSAARALLRRLGEVAFQPPARVARTQLSDSADLDVAAVRTIAGRVRTADLVHAAVRGVATFNRARGTTARRIAIAVGASRRGGEQPDVTDSSALLRLRNLNGASADMIQALLREAPVQHTPAPGRALPAGAPLMRLALRALAPRLGSTLLVSHLGDVTVGGVESLAFYPVTGGGSGVSLGAVSLAGTTTLTLRGRGRQHRTDGLEELLEAITAALP